MRGNETPSETRKRLEKRNKYRNTVCSGCRHNFYNWPKESNGRDVAVPEDYSCWHLDEIKRNKCPAYYKDWK